LSQLGEITRRTKTLRQLLNKDEGPNPSIESEVVKLKALMATILSSGDLDSLLQTERVLIQRSVDDLPITIQGFCDERGSKLWGAIPDLIIDGVVYLGINAKDNSVTLNDVKLNLFPIKNVLRQLSEELDRYNKDAFDPSQFLSRLWHAYTAKADSKQRSGETRRKRISIFDILTELALQEQSRSFLKNPVKERFKSYSQHKFRADLFRLLSAAIEPSFQGHSLILEPTSVAEEGLFMYLPAIGRCAFVGHVRFDQPR
jgi:hypothetical protein